MSTRTRRFAQLVAATAVAAVTAASSVQVAGAVYSYHGSDYSYDYSSRTRLRTCDVESDSNIVKGGYSLSLSGGESGSVTDNDGANGICASGGPNSGTIRRHHTCERNHLVWDCDNWQAT